MNDAGDQTAAPADRGNEAPVGQAICERMEALEAVPVAILERVYQETGNPFMAWEIWQHCRSVGRMPPDMVLRYIDGVAAKLLEETKIATQNRPAALRDALGIISRAGRGQYEEYRRLRRDWRIAFDFGLLTSHASSCGRLSKAAAVERLAENHNTTPDVVKRAVREIELLWSRQEDKT